MAIATVVIPTLNEEKNIKKVLDNLQNQTVRSKVIVVDGGSRDRTVEIARSYDVEVIVRPSSVGLARHIGTVKASTPLVLHTDADARLPPEWVESHVHRLKKWKVVTGSVLLPAYSPLASMNLWLVQWQELGAKFGHVMAANLSFRKSVYTKETAFPNTRIAEDVLFLRKVKRKFGNVHLHDPHIKVWMLYNPVSWFRRWLQEVASKYASQCPEE